MKWYPSGMDYYRPPVSLTPFAGAAGTAGEADSVHI